MAKYLDSNGAKVMADEIKKRYTKPSTGIPKEDLESKVQKSLDRADTALQTLTIGSVESVSCNENPSVEIGGTPESPTLSFKIPKGKSGHSLSADYSGILAEGERATILSDHILPTDATVSMQDTIFVVDRDGTGNVWLCIVLEESLSEHGGYDVYPVRKLNGPQGEPGPAGETPTTYKHCIMISAGNNVNDNNDDDAADGIQFYYLSTSFSEANNLISFVQETGVGTPDDPHYGTSLADDIVDAVRMGYVQEEAASQCWFKLEDILPNLANSDPITDYVGFRERMNADINSWMPVTLAGKTQVRSGHDVSITQHSSFGFAGVTQALDCLVIIFPSFSASGAVYGTVYMTGEKVNNGGTNEFGYDDNNKPLAFISTVLNR